MTGSSARHQGTTQLLGTFRYEHLATGAMRQLSKQFHDFAHALVDQLADGPELTTALRKLRESKDCAIVQLVADQGVTAVNRVVEQSPQVTVRSAGGSMVDHAPLWTGADLPIDREGNTRPGFRCRHLLENGMGECDSTTFDPDSSLSKHSCWVGPAQA